ncbi:MAG: methionine--tRNA ligase subunit beta [Candidatus Aenigmarchaeota archaeon]|nr:methionine--tRNA ligase subunit beta [Candidatus Aenigmarchaeota archaeon]
MITFNDFKKLEMKVGTIKKAEEIPTSKKLIRMQVDIGGTMKQVIAGIKGYYKPEELQGKQFVFLTNLEPAKLMGELSEIMILAAVKGDKVVLIRPEKEIDNGAVIE